MKTHMQVSQHIKSISYLKSHAAQISEDLGKNGTPFIITQNGEASMVIEGVKQYQDKENLIAMLRLMALGENDRLAGAGHSVDEARALLEQKRKERSA
jgi:acyl-homoserine lactone acylase PvdQ